MSFEDNFKNFGAKYLENAKNVIPGKKLSWKVIVRIKLLPRTLGGYWFRFRTKGLNGVKPKILSLLPRTFQDYAHHFSPTDDFWRKIFMQVNGA